MEKAMSIGRKALTWLLAAMLVVGWGGVSVLATTPLPAVAAGVDVGANPAPKVDIAVSLPSDYPGTFLEFKQELTQKLIDQGMAPGTFRITDTAAKIDTSNTEGWLVYNHSTGTNRIADYFDAAQGKLTNGSCVAFDSHIYNFTQDGKTSMVFAGYPKAANFDGMIYPAPSNARRTFSFDVNGSAVKSHTLAHTGFIMNAGKNANGTLSGYYLRLTCSGNAIGGAAIYKFDNFNPSGQLGGTQVPEAYQATNLGSEGKARFTVELRETSVTVQKQNYDKAGNLGDIETLFNGPVALQPTGYNGFGPYMQNSGHNCSTFTQFSFLDLEMKYDSSAFDALKTTQYYEGAQQKYFINLAGDSNDPQIPDDTDETFDDGINRMNENEIFYISNAQDGKIVRDTVTDPDGTVHQGLGAQNGFIAMSDDYATEMAEYIYTNFIEGREFDQAPIASEIPLANFYMVNAATGEQLMTVHQRHLYVTNETVAVNFHDKSIIGQAAGADGRIAQWCFRVLDPDNNQVYTSGWVDSPLKVANYIFDKNSKNGKWIFELTVKDQKGNESKASQTYITAFLDDKVPLIEGDNSMRNIAKLTFTDTGQGIDEDGITFIEDNRGSGVAAYWITNDESANPTEDDWIYFDEVAHSATVDYPLNDTKPLVVWVKDECGNLGAKTVFQPTRVLVQDPDGNPIDDYIVIDDNPIIVLPDSKDLDDPDDPEDKFAGWTTPGGDPVTPGTNVPKNEDHTIIIRPSYAKDSANLIYLANGGQIGENDTAASASFQVISGNSILQKIEDQKILPVREGYSFKGWKLIDAATNKELEGLVDLSAGTTTAPASKLVSPDDRTAKLIKVDESDKTAPVKPENIKMNNYYLVAQWEIGSYTLRLDANEGTLGSTRSFENIDYQYNIGSLNLPINGRAIPSKPGYIFQGWSTSKNAMDGTANVFKLAQGVSGITTVAAPTMPSHDMTIYAVWKEDKAQFVVHFDSNGGSRIPDQAYKSSTATNYVPFKTPQRPGYDFNGWYLVDENGGMGKTPYTGTEAVVQKSEHTFKAQWTPKIDTKYTVDYYVNSGNKDASGNYIYTKVNDANVTKTYTGTTEKTASVDSKDILPEITAGGKTYWFNENSARVVEKEGQQVAVNNNVLTGQITGSPLLSLKLYYDRYLNVNADCNEGGTVTPALDQREGSSATVTWQADEGYQVKRVTVDGVIRDDLKNATSVTLDDVRTNHKVYVTYAPTSEEPTPGPTNPETKRFKVNTAVNGLTHKDLNLTPSYTLNEGAEHEVTWTIPVGATLKTLKVDGVEENPNEYLKDDPKTEGTDYRIGYENLKANHSVEITVTTEGLPKMGGSTTNGHKTITMNRYGGDSECELSPSVVGDPGDEPYTATWKPSDDYGIYKVVIDGKEISKDAAEAMAKTLDFKKNHVVDVYFAKKIKKSDTPQPGTDPTDPKDPGTDPTDPKDPGTDPKDPTDPGTDPKDPTNPGTDPDDPTDEPELEDPDFSEMIRVTTKIEGHEGTITPSATIEKTETGEDFVVDWNMKLRDGNDTVTGDLSDPNMGVNTYKDYKIVDVTVNGESTEDYIVLKDNGQLTLKNLKEDADVVVKVESDLVDVKTDVMPEAAEKNVSKSISVYKGQNYVNIMSEANDGYKLVEVLVNGELLWNAEPELAAPNDQEAPADPENPEEAPVIEPVADTMSVATEAAVDEAASDEAVEAEADAEEAAEVPPAIEEGVGEGTEFVAEENAAQTHDKISGEEEATAEPEVTAEVASVETPEAVEDTPVPLSFRTYATAATGLNAEAYLPNEREEAAGDVDVEYIPEWEMMPNIRLANTTTAEVSVDKSGHAHLKNIQDDQNVLFVYIAEDEKYEGPGEADKYRTINLIMKDERGSSIPGQGALKTFVKGQPASISWTIPEGYERVEVNGDPDYKGSSWSTKALDNNEDVIVIVKRKEDKRENYTEPDNTPPSENQKYEVVTGLQGGQGWISGAGDYKVGKDATVSWGVSDEGTTVYMVYVDGKARPDLADKNEVPIGDAKKGSRHTVTVVLKSGDETPTNIDRDNDGEPDVNIDENGDGEPDVNIDTNGDGEPDKNIRVPEEPVDPQNDDPSDPSDPADPTDPDDQGNNGGTTGGNGTDDESNGAGNGTDGQGNNSGNGNGSDKGSGSSNGSGLDGAATTVRLALAQTGDNLMPLLTLMGLVGCSGLAMMGASALRRRNEKKEN